jgi:hypothetical protein
MATTLSTYLGLVKPTPGTKEPYSRTVENANVDKVDSAIGPKFTNTATSSAGNTTTETQMYGATILPASQQTVWKISAFGTVDNTTGSPTVTYKLKIGGVVVATVVLTMGASAGTNRAWNLEGELVCITTGVTGTWSGTLHGHANTGAALVVLVDSTVSTITRDTTIGNVFEITATWSAANAANIARCPGGYIYRVTNA